MINVINSALIKKLTPAAASYDVRDQHIKGFMLRVYPTGRMTYKCEYARGRRITIGDTEVVTVAQARERAKQILGDAARGLDPKDAKESRKYGNKVLTFKQFFQSEYKTWLKANKPETADITLQRIENRFMKYLGHLPLNEINPRVIEKWRLHRLGSDGVELITANKEITMLKAVLSRSKKWGFVKTHPLEDFEMGKLGDNSRVRFLEKEEYIRLMKALEEHEEELRLKRDKGNAWRAERSYDLYPDLRKQAFVDSLKPKVIISLASGMRKCELRRIRKEKHIDFQRQGLYLTPEITKAKKPRFIPLDDKTWKILMDWLRQTEAEYGKKGLVFPGKDGESEFDNMTKAWSSLLEKANIKDFTWHDMRHDYASQLVMSGVDLNTVRELLGHADLKMTIRYAHLAPEHKAAAVNKLSKRREDILAGEK